MSEDQHKLFIDKYCPSSFNDVKFNIDIANKLKKFSQIKDIPHMIFIGPKSCGKKTFANLFIKEKFGKEKLTIKQQQFNIKYTNKTINLQLLYSNYHYQLNPSMYNVYDRLIIQGFIKDTLQSKPISETSYHNIIIENAEKLTLEAQQSLRRTLEKHIDNCRFIFLVNQESKLIDPLMSRCIQFRLSSPTNNEIQSILESICENEGIMYEKSQLCQITKYSKRNLSTAINMLQYLSVCESNQINNTHEIQFDEICEIDSYLNKICLILKASKNIKDILSIRNILYDLLIHCVEPIEILKGLYHQICQTFKPQCDEKYKHQLVKILITYENTLKQGSKPIYHLEGFVVSVYNLLRKNY